MTRKGGQISMKGMGKAISKQRSFKQAAQAAFRRRLAMEKSMLINEFSLHPVTQEIEAGVNAENISNTLGGAGSDGKLFTFIGFGAAGRPTTPVKTIIREEINVTSVVSRVMPRPGATGNVPVASISVSLPPEGALSAATPLPWEPGKSWVRGIEEGISGFGHYMYKKFLRGRSKYGLQSKKKVRNASFRPVPYFHSMIQRFAQKLRRI